MPYDGPDGYELAVVAASRGLRPPVRLRSSRWATENRILPYGKTSQGGPWDPQRVPYLNAVMDACDDEHPAPVIVFVKPSQVGGTQVAVNVIGKTIDQTPRNILMLYPNEKGGSKWVRSNLNPMISLTPRLRAMLQEGRRDETSSSVREKHFPHCILYTGSAGIAQDLAQVNAGMVIFDDVDRMPAEIDGEGDPIALGMARLTTDVRRKAIFISSPTTEDGSVIWPWWLRSTQDRYHVPCPLCGAMQWLNFDNLKWSEGRPELAAYECEHCENAFTEAKKRDMLNAGEWRAEHPEREEEVKGFSVNGLYTPAGLGFTWIDHAKAWDAAKGKPAKVQVYFNTRRGEVVKSEKVRLEWQTIAARREPYRLRTIPPGYLILTAGVDFQIDRAEAAIIGIGRGEKIAVVDYAVRYGDPTRDELWTWLDDYLAQPIANSFGVPMRLSGSMLDSGNWQQEVINFTRTRRARGIFAGKGSSVRSRQPIGRPSLIDVNYRGASLKRGAEQYQLGVSQIKRWLYSRLTADAGTEKVPVLPADRHFRMSNDLPDEWCRQLAAERFDERDGWVKVYSHNEALDTVVNAVAMAQHHTIGVHRYREMDWQRLEQLYERPAATTGATPSAVARAYLPLPARVG